MARDAAAARWAASLFAAAGLLAFVSFAAPAGADRSEPLVALLAAADLALAACIARRAPAGWDRRTLTAVAGAGLVLSSLFALAGAVPTFGHPTFFLLLFVWIGSALPRGSALRLAAPAAIAYAVPLIARGAPAELVASVVVAIPVMVLIAEVTAASIARLEQLNAALFDAARSDELTGVGNRRRADELVRGLAPGDGLIMIDVDHFKRVNDHHGLDAGDQVLTLLGSLLHRVVRSEDLVARFGGDEFVVIAPMAGANARLVAERIAAAWNATAGLPTLSIGVAERQPHESAADTLRRADAAVYAAKQADRDQIRLAEPEVLATRPVPSWAQPPSVGWA